jgi:hypothetical protein
MLLVTDRRNESIDKGYTIALLIWASRGALITLDFTVNFHVLPCVLGLEYDADFIRSTSTWTNASTNAPHMIPSAVYPFVMPDPFSPAAASSTHTMARPAVR